MLEYSMSKAAMNSLTRSLANISGNYGITVNTVAPGLIMTEELAARWDEVKLGKVVEGIPLQRGADTDEIVNAVRFAINNSYITGEIININGGIYMP
jgi:NAD(P)-dependent dehydrogenase (short-subunit alcohol dehydrogenase family)